MRPSQAIRFAVIALNAGKPFCFVGPPGAGKTAATKVVANLTKRRFIMSNPSVEDVSVPGGLPMDAGDHASFKPYGVVYQAISSTEPTLWCLEDIGQADAPTQAGYMPWLGARRLGEFALPDCVMMAANTNRKEDNANVQGMLDPVKTRFGALIDFEPHIEDWVSWYATTGLPFEFSTFLRIRPEMLLMESSGAEIKNYANPRTWEDAARLYKSCIETEGSLPAARDLQVLLACAIGDAASTEFVAFIPTLRELPDLAEMFDKPETVFLPDDSATSTIIALASVMAQRAEDTPEHHEALVKMAERLHQNYGAEYPVMLIREASARLEKFAASEPMARIAAGPLGSQLAML